MANEYVRLNIFEFGIQGNQLQISEKPIKKKANFLTSCMQVAFMNRVDVRCKTYLTGINL